jgi:DNA repair exonuclease SbcCD ATPase subunit
VKLGFGKIDIVDFKSIAGLQFEFGRGAGLHFITGHNALQPRLESNGVGKSSLFDALTWCLTGKTVGGLRGPDVVPWSGGQPTVILTVLCDGVAHRVQRQHSPNRLLLDDRAATQEDIDKLVGMNHTTLCHTLILGQGRPLFFDLAPSQKLELFADVLDLARWDARSDKANLAARGLEIHNAAGARSLEHMRAQHRELGLRWKELKLKSDQWEEEHQALVREGEQRAAELRTRIAEMQPRVDDADLAYDGAVSELEPLRTRLTVTQRLQQDAAHKLHEFTQLSRGRNCPTCGQSLPDRRLVTPAQLNEAKATDADLRRQLALLDEAEAKLIRQRDAARAQLDLQKPQLIEAQAKLSLIVDRVQRDAHEGNPLRPLLQQVVEERTLLKHEFQTAQQALAKAQRQQARLGFWVKGFKDLKLHVIEETLAELQLTANAMLEQVGLVGWALDFEAERETKKGTLQRGLNVLVRSPHNDAAVKWECWSGGEGQRLRVLGALALGEVLLNRAGIEPTLEVLDEPTSHLSSQGVYDLIDMLYERARLLGRTILYSDQTAIASDRFAGVLTVERSAEGTQIR